VSSGEGHLTVIVYGHAPEGQEWCILRKYWKQGAELLPW
jgi:hypothetical protein